MQDILIPAARLLSAGSSDLPVLWPWLKRVAIAKVMPLSQRYPHPMTYIVPLKSSEISFYL